MSLGLLVQVAVSRHKGTHFSPIASKRQKRTLPDVLLYGEKPRTGKELVARAIHEISEGGPDPFGKGGLIWIRRLFRKRLTPVGRREAGRSLSHLARIGREHCICEAT